ncbi:MAG: hypothetical protein GW779_06600 [Candidatus Altiarchaeum hamiconexum]|uniref:Uncharacterized protein n=1 Tax=Candidatus Altarchaeum hamiconexum TaxID=1803513 RepID=A0A8J8CF28_9ARCH|nr:hypothetical protein [Candidatus Altarchaeum hamiconexum]OIQ05217.1 MAG: hypothetical protein AUK59_04725 [Candidatus Altarchaeum sp. CG2_30_32_3053]PIN67287.1 MAG: hypothetical protein COV98_03695 [Candidatus Altarchaeum sp. CG12_big_fil_rev_8_21_14_0_65_33_22]PIV27052.1 MAG: hypothetical protein COS36_07180 [Candidatus Altarchaeum sp. CG03_land_8_20_14_0_80_32_618]PJC15839.1 MAG: hypothetical protein CO063_00555 [Candidatus Altarchaeum sp. CG_4_9_14_0_8_um_filter_32_206]
MSHTDKITNTSTDKQEISAICFSSLPLVNFGDKRAAFFSISLKTEAKATINENRDITEIYGCDELKSKLEIFIDKIFKKFEFPYGINIQISSENKNDKFSIFSAVCIAAYGVVANRHGIVYDEIMEKKLRSDKLTKRKLIKIKGKIYTYREIFEDIISLINSDITCINYIQAYSSYFGGIAIGKTNETNETDKSGHKRYEILRYAENEKLQIILIPKNKEDNENTNINENINIKGAADMLWDEILKGNFYTAANLGCVLQSFGNTSRFHELLNYLMKEALYCGMTDDYVFGVFRKNTNFDEVLPKYLFDGNLIILSTNNSPAGIY